MTRYCLTIFLSAFLLFQVQPLIGRYILPWFGGSPAVWTTCMLFFQSLLLAGYAYAHGIVRWGTPRAQSVIHCVALLATLFLLPITPRATWKPTEWADPTWHILLLLLLCVGAPYMFLSATSPLIQSWFSRTHVRSAPYRLYALSNVGSLLGLLTYPLVVERFLPLESQAVLWSGGYALFVVLCIVSAVQVFALDAKSPPPGPLEQDGEQPSTADQSPASAKPPGLTVVLLWLSLACCGSVMLLATTNVMCRDVASAPFLWVAPLALYLLSFIVCFDREQWYKRDLFGVLLVASAGVQVAFTLGYLPISLWLQIAHFCFLLTVCCFICHGELVRLKPPTRFLTHFYLTVSAGGALGGVLVTWVAPAVFTSYFEFQAAIGACMVLLLLMYRLDRWKGMDRAKLRTDVRKMALEGAVVIMAIFLVRWAVLSNQPSAAGSTVCMKRNFYGALRVSSRFADTPENHQLVMAHGTTIHGFQFQDERKRQVPTSYYARQSGIAVAIENHPRYLAGQEPLRLGVIGLGTGTLACYARDGDYLRFYEIDPLVVELSDKYFTFGRDARGRGADVDVYLGDARIVMERQLARGITEEFDVLAVDAFSSDAIPVHLLTWECFEIYTRHLKEDGIIAFHVSNRHLDLAPVVRKLAQRGGMQALRIKSRPAPCEDGAPAGATEGSNWILVTNNDPFLRNEDVQDAHTPWGPDARPPVAWTDDFSNLFQVLGRPE